MFIVSFVTCNNFELLTSRVVHNTLQAWSWKITVL